MSQPPVTVPRELDRRCDACGAMRPDPREAASAPVPPAAGQAAPAGTRCEWCGAEFPDETDG
jgi:hypothetical protein